MKNKLQTVFTALIIFGAIHHAAAQGTAFTYQGQLISGTNPANGNYDIKFTLYNIVNTYVGATNNLIIHSNTPVANGLFTTTLDFGPGVFTGSNYWLDIAVRTNGASTFTELTPRQLITPTPYAIYAQTGGAASNFTGVVTGDVSGTQDALVVTTVGGQTAASIAQGVVAANHATPLSVPNSIVGRDTNGNISAHALTLSGELDLPYPAILSAGGTDFLLEEGNLYLGKQLTGFVLNQPELFNTGLGDYALGTEATTGGASGNENTAVGEYALFANTAGGYNTAVGLDALQSNNGFNNTAVGWSALQANTIGHANTAIGFRALYLNTNGSDNVAMGYDALESNLGANGGGMANTAIGVSALAANTNGTANAAVGVGVLGNNPNGNYNTGVGSYAMSSTTNDSGLVAVGYEALLNDNAGGTSSTASQTGENTGVGYQALMHNTDGFDNTANGFQALLNNSMGYANTATGSRVLPQNTSGACNTGTGFGTLLANTTGSLNTGSGYNALSQNSTGANNTAEGAYALAYSTGSNNIALGFNAGTSLITGNSNIYIGNPGVNGDNHAIRIGDVTDTNVTVTVIAGIFNGTLGSDAMPVEVDDSGHLGVRVSAARFKHDIQPRGEASDVLLRLKPVTFKYNADRDPGGTPEFGLVAEQVNEVDPDLVVRDGNHQIYSVRYEAVNAMLLNEFLKQHQTLEAQNAELVDLKSRLEKIEQNDSDRRAN